MHAVWSASEPASKSRASVWPCPPVTAQHSAVRFSWGDTRNIQKECLLDCLRRPCTRMYQKIVQPQRLIGLIVRPRGIEIPPIKSTPMKHQNQSICTCTILATKASMSNIVSHFDASKLTDSTHLRSNQLILRANSGKSSLSTQTKKDNSMRCVCVHNTLHQASIKFKLAVSQCWMRTQQVCIFWFGVLERLNIA